MEASLFGVYLKELRSIAKLTIRELEEKSGVSNAYLSQLENGKRGIPSPEILNKLSKPLDATYDELMYRAGYVEFSYSYQPPIFDLNSTLDDNTLALFLLGKNLKILRERHSKEIMEIVMYLQMPRNDYFALENGKRSIGFTTLGYISKLYNLDAHSLFYNFEYLSPRDFRSFLELNHAVESKRKLLRSSKDLLNKVLSGESDERDVKNEIEEIIKESVIQIPIYGEVKAGYDFVAEQNIIGYEFTSKKSVADGQYFYLLVRGDSMIDIGIIEGCKVLVRKQSNVENGKIGVCVINDDEVTLKRVFYDGDKIILMAENKKIPPKTYDLHEVMIQGQVKSYVVDL